jgi:hypothetical protein
VCIQFWAPLYYPSICLEGLRMKNHCKYDSWFLVQELNQVYPESKLSYYYANFQFRELVLVLSLYFVI